MNAAIKRRIDVIEHSDNENDPSRGTHRLSSHKLATWSETVYPELDINAIKEISA